MLITPVYQYSPSVIHRCIDAIVNSTYCVLYQDILTQQLYALCWYVMPVLQSNAINELVLWIKVLFFFHESAPKPKTILTCSKMTSSNGIMFRVIGPLCGEFTGHPWIPPIKASDAELWCFLWSAPCIKNREAGDLRRHRSHYDVIVMQNAFILRYNCSDVIYSDMR